MKESSAGLKIGPPYTPAYEEPPYSEDGVDLTLIRWMLSLTPEERLKVGQSAAQAAMRLKDVAKPTTD